MAKIEYGVKPDIFKITFICDWGLPLAVSDQFTLFRIHRSDVWLAVSLVPLLATSFLEVTALSVVRCR